MQSLPEVIPKKGCHAVLIITDTGVRVVGLLDPLYPVPVLMDVRELERYYYQLME